MKQTLKLGITLAAFAAISCTILAVVNNVTSPIIKKHALEKANTALTKIFPTADSFVAVEDISAGGNNEIDEYLENNVARLDSLHIAFQGDTVIGAVVQANGPTYTHTKIMVGINKNLILTGITILETSDTPGYGLLAKEPAFYKQFSNKDVSSPLVLGQNFDGISGATITSKGYENVINFSIFIGAQYLANNYGGAKLSEYTKH
ncbi:MAG TPA: FMN-binding protein [Treponemataceae bacterium]|nr:FMN-binding protein [Treponemataceae bacterium]